MITKRMEEALNKQVAMEGYASFIYLSMASWCERESLEGCAQFMHRQSEEERMHMLKLFNYINEVDGHALAPGIQEPPHTWNSIQEMFSDVYAHEQKVTAAINELVSLSMDEKDHATYNFLQWYVDEQREEEALMRNILDRIKLIGEGPMCLYYIDNEVSAINKAAKAAEGGA